MASPNTPVIAFGYHNYRSIRIDGKVKTLAICNTCSKEIKGSGSTSSNFIGHLKRHALVYKEFDPTAKKAAVKYCNPTTMGFVRQENIRPLTSPSTSASTASTSSSTNASTTTDTNSTSATTNGNSTSSSTHAKERALAESIAWDLIVDSAAPLSLVEKDGFWRVLKSINSDLITISRQTIESYLENSFEELTSSLKERLSSQLSLSLTVDIWSDKAERGFLGVTAHYFHAGSLNSSALAVQGFVGSPSGENVKEAYSDIITRYGIQSKISFVLIDNAADIKKGFETAFETTDPRVVDDEMMWEPVDVDSMELPQRPTRLGCFAHSLQLVINDAIQTATSLGPALAKVIRLCNLLHSSASFQKAFDEKFSTMTRYGIPQANTMWNSVLRSVEAVVFLDRASLTVLCAEEKQPMCIFTAIEFAQLEELYNILLPFVEATDITHGNKAVTISHVVPLLIDLYNHASRCEPTYLSNMVAVLQDGLMDRFEGAYSRLNMSVTMDLEAAPYSHEVYLLATVLDPNMVLYWVDLDLSATADEKADLRTQLKDMVCSWAWKMFPVKTEFDSYTHSANRAPSDEVLGSPEIKRLRLNYRQRALEASGARLSGIQEQWTHYIGIELPNNEINPVEFWENSANVAAMPSLSQLAKHVLCIPATSSPVERIFSHGGVVQRSHRATMSDANLEQILVLKSNRLMQSRDSHMKVT